MTAIAAELDLLGVMVLAFATALRGGMTRDMLIGAAQPWAPRDWRYAVTAFAGGAGARNPRALELAKGHPIPSVPRRTAERRQE
jgi:hypothetical protein